MRIETADERDLDEIVRLNRQVQAIHVELFPEIFKEPDGEELRDFFTGMLRDEQMRVLLAREGERTVGYMLLRVQERPEHALCHARRLLYIDQICVDEEARHRGVGRGLVDAARFLARQLGIGRIELDVWSANERGKRAFEGLGFHTYNENMFLELD